MFQVVTEECKNLSSPEKSQQYVTLPHSPVSGPMEKCQKTWLVDKEERVNAINQQHKYEMPNTFEKLVWLIKSAKNAYCLDGN